MNSSSEKLWRNKNLNIGRYQKLSLLGHFGLSGSLIFLSINPPQVQRFREPLILLIVTKASKPLHRILMLPVNQKDLRLLIETSNRRRDNWIKCKQSTILNLRIHDLGFRVYHSFIKFDDWQAVCADLKEVPLSRLLKLTTLHLRTRYFYM